MDTINAKLFAWQRMHIEVQDARRRFKQAMSDPTIDVATLQRMDTELRRLEKKCYHIWVEMDRLRTAEADKNNNEKPEKP